MSIDLHPYDNVERRFRHTDANQKEGRAVVAQVLRQSKLPVDDLYYDLSFFSGGIGVHDQLSISLPATPALWSSVTSSLRGRTLEEAIADQTWIENLLWLLTHDEEAILVRPAAVHFINHHRREFQADCDSASRILFGDESDVNDWTALWGDDTWLNFLGYSQG